MSAGGSRRTNLSSSWTGKHLSWSAARSASDIAPDRGPARCRTTGRPARRAAGPVARLQQLALYAAAVPPRGTGPRLACDRGARRTCSPCAAPMPPRRAVSRAHRPAVGAAAGLPYVGHVQARRGEQRESADPLRDHVVEGQPPTPAAREQDDRRIFTGNGVLEPYSGDVCEALLDHLLHLPASVLWADRCADGLAKRRPQTQYRNRTALFGLGGEVLLAACARRQG
jgi:hypothetical protein